MTKSARRSTVSNASKGRVIALTPVRLGKFTDSGYAKTVNDNLARIQRRKQSQGGS